MLQERLYDDDDYGLATNKIGGLPSNGVRVVKKVGLVLGCRMKENVAGMESNMEHLLDTVIFTLPHL
jgi:hypothetical protein